MPPRVNNPPTDRELAVLVHGIGSTRWLLWPLARRLERMGYATRLWSYLTFLGSNRQKGRQLAAELHRLADSGRYARIHVVAHSMGSIVTRCAFGEELPEQLGRVVMIGPPNQGSHMATRLTKLYGRLSPTLAELQDTPDSFVNQLPGVPERFEVGVLAPRGDRMIHLSNTHVVGERDHQQIDGWHTSALWKPQCAEQVACFLQTGRFKPAAPAPPAATVRTSRSPRRSA